MKLKGFSNEPLTFGFDRVDLALLLLLLTFSFFTTTLLRLLRVLRPALSFGDVFLLPLELLFSSEPGKKIFVQLNEIGINCCSIDLKNECGKLSEMNGEFLSHFTCVF